MEDMLSEIRLALLEADVNYQVVKEFIAATKEKALGQDVLGSLKLDGRFLSLWEGCHQSTKIPIN